MTKIIPKIKSLFGKPEAPETCSRPEEQAVARVSSSLDKCVTCGVALPLRLPNPGEAPSQWGCARCGHRYVAVLDENGSPEAMANLNAVGDTSRRRFKIEQDASNDFVSGLQREVERRADERFPLVTTVLATPIDALHNQVGDSFLAHTRDFSAGGVCIVHRERPRGVGLALEHLSPEGELKQVLIRVSNVNPTADGRFKIGGKFVESPKSAPALAAASD